MSNVARSKTIQKTSLLEVVVLTDEIASLSRIQNHLLLEKPSLWHHKCFKDNWQGAWKDHRVFYLACLEQLRQIEISLDKRIMSCL